jgi:Ca-activated chloride channel family protein
MMRLQFPFALLLLPIAGGALMLFARRGIRRSQTYSGPFKFAGDYAAGSGVKLSALLLPLALGLLTFALARPQNGFERLPEAGEGVDIVITLDVSSSMLQEDYDPDRLQAAKDAALSFIAGRPNDRIGLVIYAAEPRTVCPPTFDHATLERFIRDASIGGLEDGTAIGAGLAVAARGFGYSKTSRRVIVLISDGEDTSGLVDPVSVAEAVHVLHGDSLRVYTIAIGMPSSVSGWGVDRETLSSIAGINGGMLFNAASSEEMEAVYGAIDSLEASTLPAEGLFVYRDHYLPCMAWGLALLALYMVLRWRLLKVLGD